MFDAVTNTANRQRNIRIVLFIIILMTTPFYCIGFLLWGTAQPRASTIPTAVTNTPIGAGLTPTVGLPTVTRIGLTPSLLSPLQPTPIQFVPINRPPTQFIPPTDTPYLVPVIPVDTLAPTLTLIPSATPLPTSTPLPTFTPPPVPTDAPPPTATTAPTNTEAVPPSITPLPFEDTTIEAPPP